MQMLNPMAEGENELAKSYWREHRTIAAEIEGSFSVVAPSLDNYAVYGTQFEKIIYQACVGIESLFNKILSDNGHRSRDAGMTTFVKLRAWLCVQEYTLEVVHYPWLPDLHPFKDWHASHPSRTLPWFNAYNALKHDRQNNRSLASLENSLNATAAHYVMTFAVFGGQMFPGYLSDQFFFHFRGRPTWTEDDWYAPPPPGAQWTPQPLSL